MPTMPDDLTTDDTALTLVRRAPRDVVLMPVMDVKLAKQRLEELQEFCAGYLQESKDGGTDGGDYGVIPGAGKKKVLLKSGAEKLCDVYGLADRYRILSRVEDYERGLFDYTVECVLVRKTDEMFVGSGLGSCSTYESKYRWRTGTRVCPDCGKDSIIKGKAEWGGGFVCWKNKGGCGSKFSDTDPAIADQKVGRSENPDIADAKNTVLKMAKKRAKIDAVIGVTRSSGLFTQDLDEDEHGSVMPDEPEVKRDDVTVPAGSAKQAGESQADYVARVKAEAAARFGGETKPKPAPAPAPVAEQPVVPPPVKAAAAPAPAAVPVPAAPQGMVYVTAINVQNGPMAVKDGVTQPSWGPLYIIAFSAKVKASDGQMVADATTFDEAIAKQAQTARDEKVAVTPTVAPAKKKGSYNLVGFSHGE